MIHRICFAARFLPVGSPCYWENVAQFAIGEKKNYSLSGDDARVFVQNLQIFNPSVFDSDFKLTKELIKAPNSVSPDQIKLKLFYCLRLSYVLSAIPGCI